MSHRLGFLAALTVFIAGTAWGQATIEKAVYYDANEAQGWMGADARDLIHDYFVEKGYTDLDATGVKTWMDARIADKKPSVIVMSQDIYPITIVELDAAGTAASTNTTFRQYLNAGGKVIHLADWPLYNVSDAGTLTNLAGNGATVVLGFGASDVGDPLKEIAITADGTKWGVTQPWESQRAPNTNKVDVALATVNDGAAAAGWVRRFALLPGSGFVRLWDKPVTGADITEEVLADIERVADYGMDQVTGIGEIDGIVTDQSGKPVPGVQAKIEAPFGTATINTDDAGKFAVAAAAGTFKASAAGKIITASTPVDVTVTAGQKTTLTIPVTATEPYAYQIVKAATPIVIDGTPDAEWAKADPTLIVDKASQVNGGTWTGPDFLSGSEKIMFDDNYLYIYADITDVNPRINVHTDGSIWQGDGVETYVGLDGYDPKRLVYDKTKNFQWTIGVGDEPMWKIFRPDPGDLLPPEIADLEGNISIKTKTAPEKPGYIVEARMPWSSFLDAEGDAALIPPKVGTPAHLTFAINNNNDPEVAAAREFGMIFENTTDAWQNPSTWVRAKWTDKYDAPGGGGDGMPGDLNGDGKVNVQDATLSLRIAVGLLTPTDAQKEAGDVNNDGKWNIQDTTLILQVAVGNKPQSDLK